MSGFLEQLPADKSLKFLDLSAAGLEDFTQGPGDLRCVSPHRVHETPILKAM